MHRSRFLAAFAAALVASVAGAAGAGSLAHVPPGSQPQSPMGTPLVAQHSHRPTAPRSKGRHCTSLRRRKP